MPAAPAGPWRRPACVRLLIVYNRDSNWRVRPMQSGTTKKAWSGVFSVLPTPFDGSGALDLDSLARVIELYLRAGVDGLVVLGVTSEAARLNDAERAQVIERAVAAVGRRVPLVVGASADGVRRAIEYCRTARDAGAAAVLVSPPRLARPSADAVVGFYAALADAVDLPLVVQDYPPVCGFPWSRPCWYAWPSRWATWPRSSSKIRPRPGKLPGFASWAVRRRRRFWVVWEASTCSRSSRPAPAGP